MKNNALRSPLFYVGDKYKLINEIKTHFPDKIRTFVETFVGGGSVFMNVDAEKFLLNDLDSNIIDIHKMLCGFANRTEDFYAAVNSVIEKYGLSRSFREDIIPDDLKRQFVKTFYARFNKSAYEKLRDDYNKSADRNPFVLYMLLIYGFNRMVRFNGAGNFNIPVGNVDMNQNAINALDNYFRLVNIKNPTWYNLDFEDFINSITLSPDDLVYLDPPYLITFSEYNKYWNEETEKRLLLLLNKLNDNNIRFAISNVTHYKGKVNQLFLEWSGRYNTFPIKSNYISYHDNTNKIFNEVLVTNF